MALIECVTQSTENRFLGNPIGQVHELRYDSSILREKWNGVWVWKNPDTGKYGEYDQYDGPFTEYLVLRDQNLQIHGTIRIGPTTVPYMLREHFSGAVCAPDKLPSSQRHFELSRMAVSRHIRSDRNLSSKVSKLLLLAAQERGLARGAEAFWGIVHEKVIPVFTRAGYDVETTGDPVIYPNTGEHIYGVKLPVSQEIYSRCQEISDVGEPVLYYGCDENGSPYQTLINEPPIPSEDFIKSDTFQKASAHARQTALVKMELSYGG